MSSELLASGSRDRADDSLSDRGGRADRSTTSVAADAAAGAAVAVIGLHGVSCSFSRPDAPAQRLT